ncbi:MAG: hypothetical protein MUC48_06360 [Leptolyngbya sp. Prado105]|nr:hypothetical protein [Leptolyngbya sp. Prado105]
MTRTDEIHIGFRKIGFGIKAAEAGIGKEGDFEGFKEFATEEGNPSEEKADIANAADFTYPGIPEENGLNPGVFGIGEDERSPKD